MSSEYRLARHVIVKVFGLALLSAGLLVFAGGLSVALLDWPAAVLSATVVVAAVAVLAVALAAWYRSTVVRLDANGYVVRWVRGAGVKRGRWQDVEAVVAGTVAGDRCLVLRRRDGRTTTIPVMLLDRPAAALLEDLRQHLDHGHGYRRLR
ncbi:hypothetical protein BH18ACT9_BH18ACT9_07550 [soil metagenome]